jgi:uncharacterized protein YidB (DUF937 family)
MGLLDILNGMQNGPRGQQNPSAGSGGMSPITMAVLGLLAYKALKGFSGQHTPGPAAPGGPGPSALPGTNANAGGGLGDLLKGGLGGLLAGGAAGSVLSGGLGDLLKQFQDSGQGDVAKTWVGRGANAAISPGDMAQALGADQIKTLMAHSGMSRDELLAGLSQHLPEVVNQLTPEGRLPTEHELSRFV